MATLAPSLLLCGATPLVALMTVFFASCILMVFSCSGCKKRKKKKKRRHKKRSKSEDQLESMSSTARLPEQQQQPTGQGNVTPGAPVGGGVAQQQQQAPVPFATKTAAVTGGGGAQPQQQTVPALQGGTSLNEPPKLFCLTEYGYEPVPPELLTNWIPQRQQEQQLPAGDTVMMMNAAAPSELQSSSRRDKLPASLLEPAPLAGMKTASLIVSKPANVNPADVKGKEANPKNVGPPGKGNEDKKGAAIGATNQEVKKPLPPPPKVLDDTTYDNIPTM